MGQFRIFTVKQWRELGPAVCSLPLVCTHEGHWKSGVIPLGDVDKAAKLIPVVLVGDAIVKA